MPSKTSRRNNPKYKHHYEGYKGETEYKYQQKLTEVNRRRMETRHKLEQRTEDALLKEVWE